MRYNDSYRRKPTPGAGQQGSPAPHYGTFNGSAPEVGQPFGAITLPAPPPGVRNRRILHLLWWTLPIVIVFLVAGTALIGLWLWSSSTSHAVERDDWSQARVAYEQQALVTSRFPQTWVGQYNLGTALVHEGDVEGGLALLKDAFEGVPKATVQEDGSIGAFSYECSVRFNLSAAVEMQGDAAVSAADDSGAIELYETALGWVSPCQVQGSAGDPSEDDSSGGGESDEGDQGEQNQQVDPEMDQATGEAGDRLREKIGDLTADDSSEGSGDAEETPGESSDGSGQTNEVPGESPEERERREELEQKNRDQSERLRESQESRNRDPGTGGW